MFPLHDRTRRFICRAAFLLCGVLPTAVTLGWSLSMRSPGQMAAVRARLESVLGLNVQVAKVTYPRPGCTLLEAVEVADPETGRKVASARLVEISRDAQGETILASQPEIDADAAVRLKALIEGWARPTVIGHEQNLRFAAGELTLRCLAGAQTFVDCNARLESTSNGMGAEATVHLANSDSVSPIHIEWRRSSQSGQPENSLKMQADDAPLPMPLIASLVERENHCGPYCTIEGRLDAMETPDGWQAELSGRMDHVDLHSVVSEQFPHQLSGMAKLIVKHATIHAGRLEEVEGTIHAGPGTVSSSLLLAAASVLGFSRGGMENAMNGATGKSTSDSASAYEKLAAGFILNADGLTIHGQCGGKQNGVVMRSGDETLLTDSNRGPAPVVALLRMLVPDSRVQVPATRQTDWLQNLLPVPDIVPGDPQAVPQARLRGGKDLH